MLAGGLNRLDGLDRELVGPGKLAELAVAGVASAAVTMLSGCDKVGVNQKWGDRV